MWYRGRAAARLSEVLGEEGGVELQAREVTLLSVFVHGLLAALFILLHPSLPSVGGSMWMERGCQ